MLLPKIIVPVIRLCLSKLQHVKGGMFFETQCTLSASCQRND